MRRCNCGLPVFDRQSSDCGRAFCPMQRRVVLNMTALLRWTAAAVLSIAVMVFFVWCVARWVLNG